MAFASHIITVRRLEKYIDDVIGKKANLPNTNKTIIGNISQINSDLTEFSNMKSEVLGNASADWVQVGKVVTVYFATLTTTVIFNNLPIPYGRGGGVSPIAMRQASDGAILYGYLGISGGKACLVVPTANPCFGTLTYITV